MNHMDRNAAINDTEGLAKKQDEQIVSAVKEGVPEAFSQFYATYSGRLYKTIVAITRNHQDAEDALQETFLRAHLKVHTFEGRSSIYSWLTRIAINSALIILRRRRCSRELLLDPRPDALTDISEFDVRDSAPDPERSCDLRQRAEKALRAISYLDPRLQAPLRMQVTLDFSMEEISRSLNLSEATVKSRLHRARRRLLMRQESQTLRTSATEDRPRRNYIPISQPVSR